MAKRIHWDHSDINKVAQKSFELRLTGEFTDIECVRKAMMLELPHDKHRKLTTMTEVPKVADVWRDLADAQKRLMQLQPNQQYAQAIQPGAAPVEHVQYLDLQSVPFNELWSELGRRIAEMQSMETMASLVDSRIKLAFQRALPGVIDYEPAPIEQPKAPERKKLLKVFVFGLLNGQQELFKREYDGRVQFLFTDSTPSLNKLRNTAHNVDWVVQMLKFSDQIKGVNQIDNYKALPGALTQLRDFLERKIKEFDAE